MSPYQVETLAQMDLILDMELFFGCYGLFPKPKATFYFYASNHEYNTFLSSYDFKKVPVVYYRKKTKK